MKHRCLHPTNFVILVVALACAVQLPGCSDPKANVVGTYEVDKTALKAAAEAEIKAKGENDASAMGAAMILGMIDAMTMTMTLNADGTVAMTMSAMGDTKTTPGTWTISGNTISLTTTKPGGSPEASTGTVSGDTITVKPPKGQKVPFDLVFHKKKG